MHPLYFCINGTSCNHNNTVVIWSFYEQHARAPVVGDDDELLETTLNEYLSTHQIDPDFVPLNQVLATARNVGVDYMPTCAIAGGFLAQEVVKYLSGKELPFANFFCLDAWETVGFVCAIDC